MAAGLYKAFGGKRRLDLRRVRTWSLAALGGALSPWPVALASLITLAGCAYVLAWLGGRLGVRSRSSLDRTGA